MINQTTIVFQTNLKWFSIMMPLQLQAQIKELLKQKYVKNYELSHYVFFNGLDVSVVFIK